MSYNNEKQTGAVGDTVIVSVDEFGVNATVELTLDTIETFWPNGTGYGFTVENVSAPRGGATITDLDVALGSPGKIVATWSPEYDLDPGISANDKIVWDNEGYEFDQVGVTITSVNKNDIPPSDRVWVTKRLNTEPEIEPNISVTNITVPDQSTVSGTFDVVARAENTGDGPGSKTYDVKVNGSTAGSITFDDIGAGETQDRVFTANPSQTGSYEVTIGSETETVQIKEERTGEIEIAYMIAPLDVQVGKEFTATVRAENTGNSTKQKTYDVIVNNQKETEVSFNIDAGRTQGKDIVIIPDQIGNLVIEVGNETKTVEVVGSVRVESISSPNNIIVGEEGQYSITASGVGSRTFDIELDNSKISEVSFDLNGGTETKSGTISIDQPGTYTLKSGGKSSTISVLESLKIESIEAPDSVRPSQQFDISITASGNGQSQYDVLIDGKAESTIQFNISGGQETKIVTVTAPNTDEFTTQVGSKSKTISVQGGNDQSGPNEGIDRRYLALGAGALGLAVLKSRSEN